MNNWIPSNPGTQNPTIKQDDSGNHYLWASNGERAHQNLNLKPNTTYTLSFDIASGEGFPAEVIVEGSSGGVPGNIVADQTYNNGDFETHTITFSKNDNTSYMLNVASAGSGTTAFDNIVLQETVYVTDARAYVPGNTYISFFFDPYLLSDPKFPMYVNGEGRKSMTFGEGRQYWAGDCSYWGVSYSEAKDPNTKLELKAQVDNYPEETVAIFYGEESTES